MKDRVGRLGFIEPMLAVAVTSWTTADAPLPKYQIGGQGPNSTGGVLHFLRSRACSRAAGIHHAYVSLVERRKCKPTIEEAERLTALLERSCLRSSPKPKVQAEYIASLPLQCDSKLRANF